MNIGYTFKNRKILELAFTHISFANDTRTESNQRLEFLGDSVLSHIIAAELYGIFKDLDEGELTKIRAALVCEKSLAALSRELDLGREIRFGRAEAKSNGKDKDSILADTFEALLGAIYLDSDFETARRWVLNAFGDRIKNITVISEINYKSELQIYFQKRDKGSEVVTYRLKQKVGPDHDPMFYVEALYQGKVIGEGSGKSRKLAEQNAARAAYEGMKK